MSAETVRRIEGDVDKRTGDVECDGDLEITGSVADGMSVRACGSIRVGGAVQAASVTAGGDLIITGGITGRQKGTCKAGGEIRAKYISNATVEADGNVTAVSEILNSQVICGGLVVVEEGAVVGGRMTSVAGLRCRALGTYAAPATVVEAGFDARFLEAALELVREVESGRKKAAKIRESVEPLLRNPKILTDGQKESAAEALAEAQAIEARSARATEAMRARYRALEGRLRAEIRVIQTVFPGVTVHLPGLEATIDLTVEGPVWIIPRGRGHDPRIVLVSDNQSAIDVPTKPVTEGAIEAFHRLLLKAA
jgi:uncharacterized protein (DUF342 family)